MNKPAIAVVGAGLIGATAALCLGKRFADYQIHWLDQRAIAPPDNHADLSSRVIACTPGSEAYLAKLGVWQGLSAERCQRYTSMQVWDQLGSASIRFEATEVGASHLGTILEVDELMRALFRQIGQQPNIRRWSEAPVVSLTETVGNQPSLVLESGESISCELIVGADGSRSPLRELAGIQTRIRPMGQTAMVAVVLHQHAHRQTAWQCFGRGGPLAFLPLPDDSAGQHQSAIVWSLDNELAASHNQLADDQLIPLLEASIDHRLGSISSIRQRAAFPLNQLHARRYVRPGLCLLGDAIHTLHPLAGQGANLGLRDVAALDLELQRAQRRGVPLGHISILRRYERSRKLENLSMLAGMEAFRHGFGGRSIVLRWLCNQGMRQVDRWRTMKNLLAKQAMH